jgi:hypothetical protein
VGRVAVRRTEATPLATAEAVEYAAGLLAGGWAAVFLPEEPARHGRLLLWSPARACPAPRGEPPEGIASREVELVLPHGRGVRRRMVEGWSVPVAVAVPALLGVVPVPEAPGAQTDVSVAVEHSVPAPADSSVLAWAAAARFALRLLAEGRLYPALTAQAYDTWRAGPYEAAHRQVLADLAAAFPPQAHCLPEPGPPPLRIAEPAVLVRRFCDAVADALARTPAVPLAVGRVPYAWREVRPVPQLGDWAEEIEAALAADVSVSLRVDPPEGRRRQFRAVLQFHTAHDPALVVEAAQMWDDPASAERLLGPRAETEMLLALRRGARAWEPLGRFLVDAVPDQLRLTDEEAFDLLGDATDALCGAAIAVHWPRELVKALTAQAVIGQPSAPGSTVAGLLDADTLLDFQWKISLGDQELTDAEMDALAETRRPLIRLREQWVIADSKLVTRARRRGRGRAGRARRPYP